MRAPRFASLVLVASSLLASCGGSGSPAPSSDVIGPDLPGQISVDAVVSYKSFEGGFYALDATDGRHFDPINLPDAYHHDGVAVHFTGLVRSDLASFHMYGSLVQLTRIAKR